MSLETEFEVLQLPDTPDVVFEHPPLVLALCQLRYNSVLNVTNASFVAPFQEALKDQYPIVTGSAVHPVGLQIGVQPGEANLLQVQGSPSFLWQFTDQDDNWKIVLAPDFLSIETRVYEHFNDFLFRLKKAVNALIQHIQPINGTRIGLRYLNEIRAANSNWSDIIRRELLGPIIIPELISNATQCSTFQQVQLRYSNEIGINFHYGLLQSGTTVAPRQSEERKLDQPFYLLDFDVFREFSPHNPLLMNSEIICQQVEQYHRTISQLFYWSVTDQYISSLGVRHYDTN